MPPTDPQRAATVARRTFLKRAGVGPQTYGAWTNAAFHDLARQIEREVDDGKRKTMVRQAEMMLEMDPPAPPVAYEKIYDAWHDRVRGQNPAGSFGIHDVVRGENGWMES